MQKSMRVSGEMEKLEDEYHSANEAANEYLQSRQDDRASTVSEILSIDLLGRMNISESSETRKKEEITTKKNTEVGTLFPSTNVSNTSLVSCISTACQTQTVAERSQINRTIRAVNIDEQREHEPSMDQNPQFSVENSSVDNSHTRNSDLNVRAKTFEPSSNRPSPTIGHDLWHQLKRVEIPIFTGDKRKYQGWRAAFNACVDRAPATAEYKLLQLRQYLAGEALQVIENLGHSETAYEAAKERLERKYGGRRRQIAVYLEDLDNFRQVRTGNARDLEQLAYLLDIAIINLKEAGHTHELGDGSLYNKLQRKLSESMLARYHRWVFETNETEGVTSLRKWVIQEAEFQTIAAETMHGLAGKSTNSQNQEHSLPRYKNQRTFFGESQRGHNADKACFACKGSHAIWKCRTYEQKSPTDSWRIARRAQLCYRCLSTGHFGNKCPKSRPCGTDGYEEHHHRLLHQTVTTRTTDADEQTEPEREHGSPSADLASHVTEGNVQEPPQQTTMITQDYSKVDYIALRTVPIVLKNGDRSMRVNALLDEASTKSYVNSDVAAELGLEGKTEKVTVNVLNGQIETFETKPVSFELQNVDGTVSVNVNAYTTNRVTGDMNVIDWNEYRKKWPYLRDVKFPLNAKRPIVDVLIGLDCLDLHCAIEEVKGQPGEPIARLTPLGWTCVGNPYAVKTTKLVTHFACTYFARDQLDNDELSSSLKRFWEIEGVSPSKPAPIVQIQDQIAMKKAECSLQHEQNMYRVSIPWKDDKPKLPENYNMALQRLENTEKRLRKAKNVGQSYSEIIKQYVEKGYVRKVPENEHSKSKWFLPHFPVMRFDKDTTKIRIVFDASAKCQGTSLNDAIHQGPKLQRDLFDVLLRFRRFPVAIVCDIAEMYLRIGISHEDQPYHRFLWRGIDQSRVPDVYEFNRVVFGMNSSPFLAQFVLQHHAKNHRSDFPLASETIDKSTYMDDSMDSVHSEIQGIQLYHQLSVLLSKAGMHARKWLWNSSTVLGEIPLEDRKAEVDLDRSQLSCAKTLGVWWRADEDVFTFKENVPEEEMALTKRNFFEEICNPLRSNRFFVAIHCSCKNVAPGYVDRWYRLG